MRLPLAVLAVAAAAPAQLTVQEYLIPRANAFPHDPAVGADGIVWYTDQANSRIGRLDPATGQIVDYPTPTPLSGPHGITVTPDGHVWYTAQDVGKMGRVTPTTGAIVEYPLPANASRPHTPIAHAGAVWFTAQTNDTYGRFDPASGQAQIWTAPPGSRPYGIAPAPDGALWIALFGTNALGRVDAQNGSLQVVRLPNAGSRPRRVVVANDGRVYYTDFARGYLGRYDPGAAQFREWATPSGPYGIWLGTDGRVWFHPASTSAMAGFDPRTETMLPAVIPTAGSVVRHMVWDAPRGRVWLALSGTRRIGRIELGPPAAEYGTACAGSLGLPELTREGLPRIGDAMTLGVARTAATLGALFAGDSATTWNGVPLPFDLTPLQAPGCFVNAAWQVPVALGPPAPVTVAVPRDPGLNGVALFWQWALVGDPGYPLVTTRGLRTILIGI